MATASPENEPGPGTDRSSVTRSEGARSASVRASQVRSRLVFAGLDALCVVAGYGFAEVFYFRDRAPLHYWLHFVTFAVVAVVATLLANKVFGLYGRMWRHAGVEEARQLLLSALTVLVVLAGIYPLGQMARFERVPLSVIILGSVFATMGMSVLRFHSRLFAWQRGSRKVGLRVAVVGTRDTGAGAIRQMLRSPSAGLVPVAVFDDDAHTHGLSLLGVPVVGGIDDIPAAADRYSLQQVLLAIPAPGPELVERVLRAAEDAGLSMKVLPGVQDAPSGAAHLAAIRQAREPRIEDLLGRTEVETDLDRVRRSLAGRRVLVTGAGGSIGSEICRQVAGLQPALLVLLDHDETHLHDTVATISGAGTPSLADIADPRAVLAAFERYRPEVVFHAAAHKHVPILEDHPTEAAKVNVFGTLNVVESAISVGTERFVQVSTDKAVHPSNVMGASKRLAEQIVLARFPEGSAYCAVRFGNVLGSRGSVIPTFARQIANGGPVTVTDREMTRFFMSVEEAVQLVLQASVLAEGGEIFMLEMGDPVKIVDLAERMIRLSGYRVGIDIPICLTGRRPGEKLGEDLRTSDEEILGTEHPCIHRVMPAATSPTVFASGLQQLREAIERRDDASVREAMFAAVSAVDGEAVVPAAVPLRASSDGDQGDGAVSYGSAGDGAGADASGANGASHEGNGAQAGDRTGTPTGRRL
jgi:FlaA1/EpsC-like NDP-sugar epimerase